jgi:ZipA, C-terminal FtsZ-binding domain
MEWTAEHPVRGGVLKAGLTQDVRERFGYPLLSSRQPDGTLRSFFGTEATGEAQSLIAEWGLGAGHDQTPDTIRAGAAALAAWLRDRPERFRPAVLDETKLAAQWASAQAIIGVEPRSVTILATPHHAPIEGKRVWSVLHGMGVPWGDMDQFQWPDTSGVSDYLFWAEVDDGDIGYALPERIAAGNQNFNAVRFTFDIARSPAPAHVLDQMVRAAEAFASACDCTLACYVDDTYVDGPAQLHDAVRDVVRQLAALGVKTGSSSVCQLR